MILDTPERIAALLREDGPEERVERLLPRVKELVPRGLITVDPTEVVLYEPYPVRRVSSQLTAADVMSHDVTAVGPQVPVRQVVELHVPPLRERREDIPALAEELARRYAERFGLEGVRLAPALLDRLRSAEWPGNVRQLENAVARLAIAVPIASIPPTSTTALHSIAR